jgi:hypothetical protein
MKFSFDAASESPSRFLIDFPAKSGGVEKGQVFIVGRPTVNDVIVRNVCIDGQPTEEFLKKRDFAAVFVLNKDNLAGDSPAIYETIRAHMTAERDKLKAECAENVRISTIYLAGKKGNEKATVYSFGTVNKPEHINLQEATAGLLNDPGQELVDYTHIDAGSQLGRAIELAADAGGNAAIIYVGDMQNLVTTKPQLILDVIQPPKKQTQAAAKLGFMGRIIKAFELPFS